MEATVKTRNTSEYFVSKQVETSFNRELVCKICEGTGRKPLQLEEMEIETKAVGDRGLKGVTGGGQKVSQVLARCPEALKV